MIYLVFYRETPYNNDVKIKGSGLKKDEKVAGGVVVFISEDKEEIKKKILASFT